MAFQCAECKTVYAAKIVMCEKCGSIEVDEATVEALQAQEEKLREQEAEEALLHEMIRKADAVECYTTETPPGVSIQASLGLVFGNSSKQAFWGFSTQANRLSRAYEVALANLKYDAAQLGADAVVGVRFALNNSEGSKIWVGDGVTGSSEAVMLLGTAVKSGK